MGLFDFFKSDEEKVRSKIRKGFDDCVKSAIQGSGFDDKYMLGIMVQAAIANFYDSMKKNSAMMLLSSQLNIDYLL